MLNLNNRIWTLTLFTIQSSINLLSPPCLPPIPLPPTPHPPHPFFFSSFFKPCLKYFYTWSYEGLGLVGQSSFYFQLNPVIVCLLGRKIFFFFFFFLALTHCTLELFWHHEIEHIFQVSMQTCNSSVYHAIFTEIWRCLMIVSFSVLYLIMWKWFLCIKCVP